MDSLKELSKSIPLKVNKALKQNKEIINIIIDKKYLWISFSLKRSFENKCLLTKIFFGLLYDSISLIEYLNKEYIFKNLKPELVEKKEPPIITRIKKIKDKFVEFPDSEIPIFETLLVNDKNILLKLLSKFKKTKKIINKKNK